MRTLAGGWLWGQWDSAPGATAGSSWPCCFWNPNPVILFYKCSWSPPFSQLGDDFCNNATTGKRSQAEGSSGTFGFSFQLFTVSYETHLMRSQRSDLHVSWSKWTGDPSVVKSSWKSMFPPYGKYEGEESKEQALTLLIGFRIWASTEG